MNSEKYKFIIKSTVFGAARLDQIATVSMPSDIPGTPKSRG